MRISRPKILLAKGYLFPRRDILRYNVDLKIRKGLLKAYACSVELYTEVRA